MADKVDAASKTHAQIDQAAIERYNRLLEQNLNREAKFFRQYEWRGNKLPPFNIEPFAHERQRLAGAGMTDADRALRKQWLNDQVLSPNEPRYVPEVAPKNFIRRALAMPWDALCGALKPIVGESIAGSVRYLAPRALIGYVGFSAAWYQLKFHRMSWEGQHGWHMYSNRDRVLPNDPSYPEPPTKPGNLFNDKGFSERTALQD